MLHPDRLFPAAPGTRARSLFEPIAGLPLVCPHGHAGTQWFSPAPRALPSIAARNDMAGRIACAFPARRGAEHRLDETEAAEVARDLADKLPRRAYGYEDAS